jgi:hypothetical protein
MVLLNVRLTICSPVARKADFAAAHHEALAIIDFDVPPPPRSRPTKESIKALLLFVITHYSHYHSNVIHAIDRRIRQAIRVKGRARVAQKSVISLW